jgi:hypothetical protein
MHPFELAISVAGAIIPLVVLAIVVLTLFFRGLAWVTGSGVKPETFAVRGVLTKQTWATVHFVGGEVYERVRFIGYTQAENLKTYLPYELNGMVILEDEAGVRFLVRAKNIKMIVVAPDAHSKDS